LSLEARFATPWTGRHCRPAAYFGGIAPHLFDITKSFTNEAALSQTKRQDERTARQSGCVSAKCLDESRSASVQACPNIGVGDVSVQICQLCLRSQHLCVKLSGFTDIEGREAPPGVIVGSGKSDLPADSHLEV
jgi:hypothetical protein